MIVGIDGEAADLAEQPVVGQRLGPEGIDLELRRIGRDGGGRKRDNAQQGCKSSPPHNTPHRLLRRFLGAAPPLPVGSCRPAFSLIFRRPPTSTHLPHSPLFRSWRRLPVPT